MVHNDTIKTAMEIGNLSGQLSPQNQAYVLNTINTLLFSQQCNENKNKDQPGPRKAG